MTLAAITLVCFLGGAFLLVLHNFNLQIEARHGNVQFQIFWNTQADKEEVQKTWAGLSAMEGVVNVRTFTPDQALDVLGESFQKNIDLDWMKGRSPLPPTAILDCQVPDAEQTKWAQSTLSTLKALPHVEKVSFNPLQVDLLTSWVGFTKMAFWPVIVFLLLVVALVVGNTIKLALLTRREELEILRFVGASRAYIQFPLLVGGLFQGVMGSALALGLLGLAFHFIKDLLNIPPLWITISFLPSMHCLTMLGLLGAVGMLSSLVALRN
jgi:cell division transport system permease protein